MNASLLTILTQFGGLGVLAMFAWVLLKSTLKQQEKLGKLLENHLTKLLERQELTNALLSALVAELKAHRVEAAGHYTEFKSWSKMGQPK